MRTHPIPSLLTIALISGLVGACDDSPPPTAPGGAGGPADPEAATTGVMRVEAVTSGSPTDADGFRVMVDGWDPRGLAIDRSLTIDLAPGDYEVRLADVAPNCLVDGDNPRTVSVAAGATVTTTFEVRCGAGTGTITVSTTTTGMSLDADGYAVSVDGWEPQTIGIQGVLAVLVLDAGDHDVELTGVASNCEVEGGASRTITLATTGDAARIAFTVSCGFARRDIAFSSNRDGAWDASVRTPENQNVEVYAMNDDGSGLVRVTNAGGGDWAPTWSPDGVALAFATDRYGGGLGSIDGGGSGFTLVTGGDAGDPAWSPDGTTIAFVRDDGWFDFQIYVVGAGGTEEAVRVSTAGGMMPAWSPDGSRIIYTDGTDLCVIAPDGSDLLTLTTGSNGGWEPAWSPDGTRIAFTRMTGDNRDVWVMDADGSNQVKLTDYPGYDGHPAWSPDGTRIAFDTRRDGNLEVYVMNADGSGLANLSNHPADDGAPSWAW